VGCVFLVEPASYLAPASRCQLLLLGPVAGPSPEPRDPAGGTLRPIDRALA